MSRAVVSDTGPLYALVDPSDEHHARARRERAFLDANHVSIILPAAVLTEAYSLILYRLGQHVALRWIDEVTTRGHVVIADVADMEQAIVVLQRLSDQPITLVDALVHGMSMRLDAPVWTYDHHFDILRANRWHPEDADG